MAAVARRASRRVGFFTGVPLEGAVRQAWRVSAWLGREKKRKLATFRAR
jgi:hypothetical protein